MNILKFAFIPLFYKKDYFIELTKYMLSLKDPLIFFFLCIFFFIFCTLITYIYCFFKSYDLNKNGNKDK
ncbi:conserved Plasmodium protein, unknown function [Plasmodium sp. gorilla clade G2]|uniref:conserved Plasmodium protein, unknown function n=1 Tax=Plasmodium sp. gorilla clade G2 TaxID=880535 RepID=UPI000D21AB46|nr:conserved Plasmodium protein, unknown function [Plasmodium sp. gorilla clade G2]SOV18787.1 conserved Plasmodium protein, unknown function [Plasmodium sp. gorilla clade G2]